MSWYSEFFVGLWFAPVLLCILTPLALLCLWSIKRLLSDIFVSVKQMEGALTQKTEEAAGELRPQPTA